MLAFALFCAALPSALAPLVYAGPFPVEGFGTSTPGGSGGSTYTVTTLADSGPGSLRDALSGSDRNIVFSVAGTIAVSSSIPIQGHHLTVDGSTAPPPGITIEPINASVESALLNLRGAHDVILRHLRVQDAPDEGAGDNLRIFDGAYNIVVDHCTFRRAGDGNLDISDNVQDVTVQWCFLFDNHKNMLIRDDCSRISLHHNLFFRGGERNPQIQSRSVEIDMVNNVICDWDPLVDDWGGDPGYGVRIRTESKVNLIKNVFVPGQTSERSLALILLKPTEVFLDENDLPIESEQEATANDRCPAPAVTEFSTPDVWDAVWAEAGAWPRDADDLAYLAELDALVADVSPPTKHVTQSNVHNLVVAPNPMTDDARLSYRVAHEGSVSVSIHAIDGRRVATVLDRWHAAGDYAATWDGELMDASDLAPPGLYLVRVRSAHGESVARLLRTR